MNIFFLHKDPQWAANALCDKHVPKMLLESAQMLSTAVRRYEEDTDTAPLHAPIYKSAYQKHPMTIWVGESKSNFKWALENAVYINHQYEQRFDKEHKSFTVIENIYNFELDTHLPESYIPVLKKHFKKVIIALDRDATSKAFDIHQKLCYYVKSEVKILDEDLKYFTTDEIRKLL